MLRIIFLPILEQWELHCDSLSKHSTGDNSSLFDKKYSFRKSNCKSVLSSCLSKKCFLFHAFLTNYQNSSPSQLPWHLYLLIKEGVGTVLEYYFSSNPFTGRSRAPLLCTAPMYWRYRRKSHLALSVHKHKEAAESPSSYVETNSYPTQPQPKTFPCNRKPSVYTSWYCT